MGERPRPGLLARLVRPLRFVLPERWRAAIKDWICSHPRRWPALNRLLVWFTGKRPAPRRAWDEGLPPTAPEDWVQNTRHEGPLVTVVVPCFNSGEFLGEALESVRRQTFQDVEIVVVDDGSDDPATLDILRSLDAPRTRVVRQENRGLAGARNTGFREARGRYVCPLDADDMLHPTHLEKLLLAIETRQWAVAFSDVERFGRWEGVWRRGPFDLAALMHENVLTCNALIRRDAWERVGGYHEPLRHGYEDWHFWIALAAAGCQGIHLPEPLFRYRRHGRSLLTTTNRMSGAIRDQIRQLHRDVFDNPQRAEAVRRAHRRTLARDAFINVGPERHRPPAPGARRCLVATPTVGSGELRPALRALRRGGERWEVVALITREEPCIQDVPMPLEDEGALCFWARPTVPAEFEADLPLHLCSAHRVELVLDVAGALSPEALGRLRAALPDLRIAQVPGEGLRDLAACERGG